MIRYVVQHIYICILLYARIHTYLTQMFICEYTYIDTERGRQRESEGGRGRERESGRERRSEKEREREQQERESACGIYVDIGCYEGKGS